MAEAKTKKKTGTPNKDVAKGAQKRWQPPKFPSLNTQMITQRLAGVFRRTPKPSNKNAINSGAGTFTRRQALQLGLVLGFTGIGLLLLIMALVLPEWFILDTRTNHGRVGFFFRCVTSKLTSKVSCYYEITKDAAAPLAITCVTISSSAISLFYGMGRILTFRCQQARVSAMQFSKMLNTLKILGVIASLSCVIAMLIFSYLYNSYLKSMGASFVLSWMATGLYVMSGVLVTIFASKSAQASKSAVGPIQESKGVPDRCVSAEEGLSRPSRRSQSIRAVDRPSMYRGNPPLHGKARTSTVTPPPL